MNTTERNWSAIRDYEGGDFGLRSFYTRQDWIEQCFDWTFGGMPEWGEEWDEDEREYMDYLNGMDDEELMGYIQEHWSIEIRETTWLKEDNECLWHTGVAGYIVKILEIPANELRDYTKILVSLNGKQEEVILGELYGLTNETCPKCGHPLYVSDLCSYQYVCLECDENFC